MSSQRSSSATSASAAPAAYSAAPVVHALRDLPYWQGQYDALTDSDLSYYCPIVSSRGNTGHAFSVSSRGEDRVVATVIINDRTSRVRPIQQILDAAPVPELRVQVRGAILQALGGIGDYQGESRSMTPDQRAAARSVLVDRNPRLYELLTCHDVHADVTPGRKYRFLNAISIPAARLGPVIASLQQAKNGRGNKHVGAERVAQVIGAATKLFQDAGLV